MPVEEDQPKDRRGRDHGRQQRPCLLTLCLMLSLYDAHGATSHVVETVARRSDTPIYIVTNAIFLPPTYGINRGMCRKLRKLLARS